MDSIRSIPVSTEYRKQTVKTFLAILLFIFTYLFLVGIALVIGIVFCSIAIFLLISRVNYFTLIFGVGIISTSVFIFIFLFGFIFKKHKENLTNTILLNPEEQPELFKLIGEIVDKVGTQFPKNVYLSAEVNAGVFYGTSFWNLFWPVRKNLKVGMGLLMSNTIEEFKSILAHEFGHFSQRSMKLSSYVYQVNKVIHNLLFENENINELAMKWQLVHSWFRFFIMIASKIVQAFQQLLQWVYKILNKNYLAMSREMEFHADATAVAVTGPSPFVTSLLRVELSTHDFNEVLNFYVKGKEKSTWTRNLFLDFNSVMNYLNDYRKNEIVNQLAFITIKDYQQLRGTRMSITDTWSTHPSMEERVDNIAPFIVQEKIVDKNASSILNQEEVLQEELTRQIFDALGTAKNSTPITNEGFEISYKQIHREYEPSSIFCSYYLRKDPLEIVPGETVIKFDVNTPVEKMFSNELTQKQREYELIKDDVELLSNLEHSDHPIKSFNYEDDAYTLEDIPGLTDKLKAKLIDLEKELHDQDLKIYNYFADIAERRSKQEPYLQLYQQFIKSKQDLDTGVKIAQEMYAHYNELISMEDVAEIRTKVLALEETEVKFKKKLSTALTLRSEGKEIPPEVRKVLQDYVSQSFPYFGKRFHQTALDRLAFSIQNFPPILYWPYLKMKKKLLDYQAQLLEDNFEG